MEVALLKQAQETQGHLFKNVDVHEVGLGWGLRACISEQLPA